MKEINAMIETLKNEGMPYLSYYETNTKEYEVLIPSKKAEYSIVYRFDTNGFFIWSTEMYCTIEEMVMTIMRNNPVTHQFTNIHRKREVR